MIFYHKITIFVVIIYHTFMSLFSDNIKHLRINLNLSQRIVAESINISRDRYAKYEDGVNEPSIDMLLSLSRYHQISIDILVSGDIRKISTTNLLKVGDNRILLPITVDKEDNNFIELITQKARAGYLGGYADPEFIENLQHISLPFLGQGKYRAFPVEGDSMPPHESGSFIVGRFVERISDIVMGKTYILLTKNEGIVYKRIDKYEKTYLTLSSDNTFYTPYKVNALEILEIWEYECNIGRNDRLQSSIPPETVQEMFLELRKEIRMIKN